MPELPDLLAYLAALEPRVVGRRLESARLASPFLLRSVTPPLREAEGRSVLGLSRIGKRIVMILEDDLFLVLHLMIAGRLRWRARGARLAGRIALAAFDFETGTLLFTEAGSKRRASLHLIHGQENLREFQRGGVEVLEVDRPGFREALRRESHTLKRALTDPRLREGMAVHGRHGKPCPDCGSPVQRIVYAENESNYCATCQTGGKLLADRALSRLLREDWPRTVEELEDRMSLRRGTLAKP